MSRQRPSSWYLLMPVHSQSSLTSRNSVAQSKLFSFSNLLHVGPAILCLFLSSCRLLPVALCWLAFWRAQSSNSLAWPTTFSVTSAEPSHSFFYCCHPFGVGSFASLSGWSFGTGWCSSSGPCSRRCSQLSEASAWGYFCGRGDPACAKASFCTGTRSSVLSSRLEWLVFGIVGIALPFDSCRQGWVSLPLCSPCGDMGNFCDQDTLCSARSICRILFVHMML